MNFQVNQNTTFQPTLAPPSSLVSPAGLPVAIAPHAMASSDSLNLSVPAFTPQVNFAQQPQGVSPYTPTLTMLNISKNDLQWATELETKVAQGYQPTAQEATYYKNLGAQLSMLKDNIQPLTPVQALPQIQNFGPAPAPMPMPGQAQTQTNASPSDAEVFGPNMPPRDQQVTMSEIEWALIVEEKVQKYDFKPGHTEELKYKNILLRFKANQEIKMTFLDSLAAQSPWVGANVASVRYSKIVAAEVGNVIKAIKGGGGSVMGGLKSIGFSAVKATGLAAVVSGGFSAVTNAIAYARGEKTKTQAIANVATDTVSGAAIGLGSTIVGAAAMTALAATSIAGFPLTLLVGGAGILGGYLADKVLQKTGAKEWIKTKVIGMLEGGNSPAQNPAPAQVQAPQAAYAY